MEKQRDRVQPLSAEQHEEIASLIENSMDSKAKVKQPALTYEGRIVVKRSVTRLARIAGVRRLQGHATTFRRALAAFEQKAQGEEFNAKEGRLCITALWRWLHGYTRPQPVSRYLEEPRQPAVPAPLLRLVPDLHPQVDPARYRKQHVTWDANERLTLQIGELLNDKDADGTQDLVSDILFELCVETQITQVHPALARHSALLALAALSQGPQVAAQHRTAADLREIMAGVTDTRFDEINEYYNPTKRRDVTKGGQ